MRRLAIAAAAALFLLASLGMRSVRPTLVLVHGAFADTHAFDVVKPLLEQRGFRVVTPLMPGHGADTTDAHAITLDRYVAVVRAAVEAEPGRVVLVGHSMAGMVVSQVAEQIPERIALLGYVAAYLPQDGQNLQALAAMDTASLVGKALRFAPDYSTALLDPALAGMAIAGDAPEAVQRMIADSQRPEPLAPFQGTVKLSPERFGRVRKAYLSTTLDRAVTPMLQERMLATAGGLLPQRIATAHLPFVTQPAEFVKWVERVAKGAR